MSSFDKSKKQISLEGSTKIPAEFLWMRWLRFQDLCWHGIQLPRRFQLLNSYLALCSPNSELTKLVKVAPCQFVNGRRFWSAIVTSFGTSLLLISCMRLKMMVTVNFYPGPHQFRRIWVWTAEKEFAERAGNWLVRSLRRQHKCQLNTRLYSVEREKKFNRKVNTWNGIKFV
jgi:hypothetical protein